MDINYKKYWVKAILNLFKVYFSIEPPPGLCMAFGGFLVFVFAFPFPQCILLIFFQEFFFNKETSQNLIVYLIINATKDTHISLQTYLQVIIL